MFVGREEEIKKIQSFLKESGSLLVYGLRRVGKTTLIKEAVKNTNKTCIYFECQKANEEINVSLFVELLVEQLHFSSGTFTTFLQVITELDKHYPNLIIVIDEYSYLKQYYSESKKAETRMRSEQLDSEFQNIIDNHLNNTNLILSGSSIYIMEKLLDHASPLYGRFNDVISLKQFNYLEARKMLPKLSLPDYIAFYSVFGGSPYVLEKINQNLSLEQNINDLILNEDGRLRYHLNSNVLNELESDADLHAVLDVIKNGSKKYQEIQNQSHISTSGLLDKKLKKLIDLNIIEARYPIGRENDRSKKHYQIKDNLLKFYYAYVFRQDNLISLIGTKRFFDNNIEQSLKEFISFRFENIVRDYFSIAVKKGLYENIIDIGTFFTGNSEFDCVLQTKNKKYTIFEVKYLNHPMEKGEMYKEIEQIKQIKGLNIERIGFVCSSGFKDTIPNISYLELNDLFFKEV